MKSPTAGSGSVTCTVCNILRSITPCRCANDRSFDWRWVLRPWLVAVVLLLAAPCFYGVLSEVFDPFTGPAIVTEGGHIDILSVWLAPFLAGGAVILGGWRCRRGAMARHVHATSVSEHG